MNVQKRLHTGAEDCRNKLQLGAVLSRYHSVSLFRRRFMCTGR